MKYDISVKDNFLTVFYENLSILSKIKIRVNYMRSSNVSYIPDTVNVQDTTTTVTFKREILRDWMWEADYVKLIFTETDGALLLKADLACRHESFAYNYTYPSYESVFIDYELPQENDGFLCLHNAVPFWLTPSFTTDIEKFAHIESLSYKLGDNHIHLLPLVNEEIKTHIKGNSIILNTNIPNKVALNSNVLILSCEKDPFKAIDTNFTAGRRSGAIKVKPKNQRPYPKQFEGFGWCTWNAFYKDVTSKKIFSKLEEFKTKNIKIKWLMIDDGWQQFDDRKLLSFKEDPKKFPEGFKNFVTKVKKEYGVEYIGVWHAFGGYWDGIHPQGEIYKNHHCLLYTSPTGWIFPGETEEKAFKFWDLWHSY